MPSLTPKELQEAKKRRVAERNREAQRREEEETALKEEVASAAARLQNSREQISALSEELSVLQSVATTYYTEMDKLAKKAPGDRITDLPLGRINKLIIGVRSLTNGQRDSFTEEIKAFEAAGENPEYRDVLFVLGEVRAALLRFSGSLSNRRMDIENELRQQTTNVRKSPGY